MATQKSTWTMTLAEAIKVCESYQIRASDCQDAYAAQYIDALLTHAIRPSERKRVAHKQVKTK